VCSSHEHTAVVRTMLDSLFTSPLLVIVNLTLGDRQDERCTPIWNTTAPFLAVFRYVLQIGIYGIAARQYRYILVICLLNNIFSMNMPYLHC
jgi:hypothetical protein